MDARHDNTEQLLEEINTQLRQIKWIMVIGMVTVVVLLLAVIGLAFFPILAGLFIVTVLIVGPVAYLYHVFVATVQHRESQLRDGQRDNSPILHRAAR